MKSRKKSLEEFPLPKGQSIERETSYLVDDLNEIINESAEPFLKGAQKQFIVEGFRPITRDTELHLTTPVGVIELEERYMRPHTAMDGADFTDMRLSIDFPIIRSEEDNPFHVELHWNNGARVVLALVDKRPILLIERRDDTNEYQSVHAAQLHPEIFEHLLETTGIPMSTFDESVEQFLDDMRDASRIRLVREKSSVADLGTEITVQHTALLERDIEGTVQNVQELTLNIDHFSSKNNPEDTLKLGAIPTFRTLLRFARNEAENGWEYKGTYTGKLQAGELLDTLEQQDPRLGVPSGAIMDKALYFLKSATEEPL